MSLARRACDWEMMQLFVGEPGSDLSVFQIVGEQPFSKDDLEEWARRAKQEQMVLRAARPAQKITSTSKQTERLRGLEKENRTQTLRVFWAVSPKHPQNPSCSVKRIEQKEEAAAASSSHAVPAKSALNAGRSREEARQSKLRLSLRASWGADWLGGPAGGQTGWGAICNMHLDKHDSGHTGCPFPQHVRQLPSRVRSPPGWTMKLGRSTAYDPTMFK